MTFFHELQMAPARIQREYAIRLRLLRSSLSLRARRAERRADVLLIAYPKCGRTWLTMLLAHALVGHAGVEEVDYLTTDLLDGRTERLPHIRIGHDGNPHWKTARGLARSKRRYRHQKVVLLVRDPRDVIASLYSERSWCEGAYPGSLSEFLHERRGSLETLLAYYNIWAEQRASLPEFLLVRYEELRADPAGTLQLILAFIGLEEVTDFLVEDAVAHASFENLRSLHARRTSDARDSLSAEDFSWMEQRIRSTLDPSFGYDVPAVRRSGSRPAICGNAAR